MQGVIVLPIQLTNPDPRVPMVRNYQQILSSLPSMYSWHSMRPEYLELNSAGEILSVKDRSGKGRHLTDLSSGNRPVYYPNSVNGRGAAKFDDSVLAYDGEFPTTAYTKLIALRVDPSSTTGSVFGQSTTSNINHRVYYDSSSDVKRMRHQVQNAALTSPNTANVIGGSVPGDEFFLVKASFHGASATVRCGVGSGAVVSTTASGLTAVQDLQNYMGAGNVPGGTPSSTMKGYVAEMIVTNVDLFAPGNAALAEIYLGYFREILGLPA